MYMNEVSIFSFNCKGFKYRNYDYMKDLFQQTDFILLQETWLYSFQEVEIKNILKGSDCYAVSGMKDDYIGRSGRPFGGCSIIWKSDLNAMNNRVCAVEAVFPSNKIIIISTYLPINDRSDVAILNYLDVLNDISAIISEYQEHEIVIGGDFNFDINRDNLSNIKDHFYEFYLKNLYF